MSVDRQQCFTDERCVIDALCEMKGMAKTGYFTKEKAGSNFHLNRLKTFHTWPKRPSCDP